MEGIAILMSYLSTILIGIFKLSGKDTLNYFFAVFNGQNITNFDYNNATSAGVFGNLYRLFMYCAFAIIFLNLIYQIFKAFFGPLASAESPTRIIFKSSVVALLVTFSQAISALIFEITQIPYDAVATAANLSAGDAASRILNNVTTLDFNMSDVVSFTNPVLSPRFWSCILCIVLFFMLIKQFLMLALELAERYLMICLLVVISPLCIACGAVRGLEDVLKNWVSWVVNGCVIMIFSTMFLGIFICNFTAQANVPYLLLWIAWFKTGQKLDEHMNSLGLKTAKTGGFGLDVMAAMRAGLPMALKAANAFNGTNIGIPFARDGGKIDPNNKNPFRTFGLRDPRTGDNGKGMTGLANNLMTKSLGAEKTAVLDNKAKKMIGGVNNVMDKFGSKHGSHSKLNYNDLEAMYNGQQKIPEYQAKDIKKDLLEMKGGKNLGETLEKNGYDLQNISKGKNGETLFSAMNQNGDTITGSLNENADPSKSLMFTGDDGVSRGLMADVSLNPDGDAKNPFADMYDKAKDDRENIVGANSENMEQSGISGGMVDVNGEKMPVFNSDIDENGNVQRYDENGNKNDNGEYVRIDDGSENGKLVHESQIQNSGVENLSSDSITKDGQSINDYNNVVGEDGNSHQIDPSSIKEENGQLYANDLNSGEQFQIANSEISNQAQGIDGNMIQVNASESATRNNDGTITAIGADGKEVQLAGNSGITEFTNAEGQQVQMANGFTAGINENGQLSVKAESTSGNMENVSGASVNIGGRELDTSKQIEYNSSTGMYSGYDTNNNKMEFNQDALNKGTSFGETSLNTSRDIRLGNNDGSNYINTSSFSETRAQKSDEQVVVQGTDGTFFRTNSTHRYNSEGQLDMSGSYMMSTGNDGIPYLHEVRTENGNVPTYNMKSGASEVYTVSGEQVRQNSNNATPHYTSAPANEATAVSYQGNSYNLYDSDYLGKSTPQQYAGIGSGNYERIDMDNNNFNSQGRVIPDKNGNINLLDSNNKSYSVPASSLEGYNANVDDGYSNVSSYYKVQNRDNGTQQFIKNSDKHCELQKVDYCSYNGIPTNMDFKNASQHVINDRYGNDTGIRNITLEDGRQFVQYPPSFSTDGAYGAYVNIGGQKMFLEPNPGNYLIESLNKCNNIDTRNNSLNRSIDITDPGFRALARDLQIPEGVKQLNVVSNGKGVEVSYGYNGKNHCITSAPVSDNRYKATEITKKFYSNNGARDNTIGYHYIKTGNESLVGKVKDKYFDTKNIFSKVKTSYKR